jgi:hypothetical protein
VGEVCACCGRREAPAPADDADEEEEEEAEEAEEADADDDDVPAGAYDAAPSDDADADASDDAEPEPQAELPPARPAAGACPLCGVEVCAAPQGWESADDDAWLTMDAIRDVAAGAEVFNTYGNRSNAVLLHMYGFTLCTGKHDDEGSVPHVADVARIDAALVGRALRETLGGAGGAGGGDSSVLSERLGVAAEAGLVASATLRAADEDGFELRPGEALPRELLLLAALAAAPAHVAAPLLKALKKLRRDGQVLLPRTPHGAAAGGAADEPAELLWHFLAAGSEGDSRAPPGESPEAAPPLSSNETRRLLSPPGAAAALRRALALREALYPTPTLDDDVAELATAREAARNGVAEAAMVAHALQLRVGERRLLAAARDLATWRPGDLATLAAARRLRRVAAAAARTGAAPICRWRPFRRCVPAVARAGRLTGGAA